jgi:hypothetical protein
LFFLESAMTEILMPKATAVWLVDNTALSFDQIAGFCGLHPLEVKGIADGDVAAGVRGADPIANGQLTREEIERAEADSNYRMAPVEHEFADKLSAQTKGPRYTPLSRRQERPDAIAWLVRNHPEVPDAQIARLIGTTKATIQAVRDRTHWNSPNIKPVDPVVLGLCAQSELDAVVGKAAEKKRRADAAAAKLRGDEGATLAPASETGARPDGGEADAPGGPEADADAFATSRAEEEKDERAARRPRTAEEVFGAGGRHDEDDEDED